MTFGDSKNPETNKKFGTSKYKQRMETEKKKRAEALTNLYKRSRSQKMSLQKSRNNGLNDPEISKEISNFDKTVEDLKNSDYEIQHLNPDNYGIEDKSSLRDYNKSLLKLGRKSSTSFAKKGIPNNLENLMKTREKRKDRIKKREIFLEKSRNENIEDFEKNLEKIQKFENLRKSENSTSKKNIKKKRQLYYFKNNFEEEVDAKIGLDMLHTDELMGYYKEVVGKGKRDFIEHQRKQNVLKKIEYG